MKVVVIIQMEYINLLRVALIWDTGFNNFLMDLDNILKKNRCLIK